MKTKLAVIVGMMMLISIIGLMIAPNGMIMNAKGQNNDPILMDEFVYTYSGDVWFEVTYIDSDGDAGEVYIYVDDVQIQMWPYYGNPSDGQDFEIDVPEGDVTDQSEFYFYTDDLNGSTAYLYDTGDVPFVLGDYIGGPVLSDPDIYLDGSYVFFEVTYQNEDGDNADVWVNFEWDYYDMQTTDSDPILGQRYGISFSKADLTLDTWFYFDAMDDQLRFGYLPEDLSDFLISDFITQMEWGNDPVLSNPDVDIEGDNVVFKVTYWDADGDIGTVWMNFGPTYYEMETSDLNPTLGQRYNISRPKDTLTLDRNFYFDATDNQGGWAILNNSGPDYLISDFVSQGQWSGTADTQNGGGGTPIGAGWLDNPEVLVAIIGFALVGVGSGYAAYRRKKKRGHFSEMLTKLDDVYRSFKMNPHKCEIELEKMRALANEDLKRGVIDESNFTIVKDRIDDMVTEIRGETLSTEVKDLPKDIEIRIKDMLIDGKLSRKEYDKLLPIITGSDMAAADKEKVQEMVEFWVDKDKKKVEK